MLCTEEANVPVDIAQKWPITEEQVRGQRIQEKGKSLKWLPAKTDNEYL